MTTSTPAISVLVPVRDAGRFLGPALDSILAQTFADFEMIVIDDGSRDDSGKVLAAFAARDPRIRVYTQENQGIVATLNRALKLAGAPLVARMDADDLSRPDRFAKQIAYLRQHPEVAVVSGAMDVIDESGKHLHTAVFPTEPEVIAGELLDRCCVCHPAIMARTAMVRSVGGYRRSAQFAEDYDLWLRIAEVGRIGNLPDVLLSYRVHAATISARRIVAQELAAIGAKAAARERRSGKPDPLASGDIVFPPTYADAKRMFADGIPGPEFALSFFRALLGRETEIGSITQWSRLYARHGLWDLDRHGAEMMIALLGHNMLRRRRSGARLHALLPYIFWAVVTAVCHPVAALRVTLNAPHWLRLARAGTPQQTSSMN
jgi:glycosyltransferase involved in cell wall biosynthesis